MTIANIGNRRHMSPVQPTHRSGHSTENPNGNATPSPQQNNASKKVSPAFTSYRESTIEYDASGRFQKAIAIYQLHEELTHRQHIESIMGVDEYA